MTPMTRVSFYLFFVTFLPLAHPGYINGKLVSYPHRTQLTFVCTADFSRLQPFRRIVTENTQMAGTTNCNHHDEDRPCKKLASRHRGNHLYLTLLNLPNHILTSFAGR